MKKKTRAYIDDKFADLEAGIIKAIVQLSQELAAQRPVMQPRDPGAFQGGIFVNEPPEPFVAFHPEKDNGGHVHVISAYKAVDSKFTLFYCDCGESVKLRGEDVDWLVSGKARNLPTDWQMPIPGAPVRDLKESDA